MEMEKMTQSTESMKGGFEQDSAVAEADPDFSKIYRDFLEDVPDDGRYLWEGREPMAIRNVAIKELLRNFEQIARMSGVMTPDKREEILNRVDSLAGEVYFLAQKNNDQSLIDRFENAKNLLP
ncbi:MAG: hypothetical protein GXP44_01520 [bacterium]|nr:hypothetical protein [bacterium]